VSLNDVPRYLKVLLLAAILAFLGCTGEAPPAANSSTNDPQIESLRADIKKIEPFFEPMGEPGQFDWLKTFKEPGQTFDEYISSDPTLPTDERRTIYVQPIGKFTAQQSRVIKTTSEYMEAFFGLPVKLLDIRPPIAKLKEPDQRMIDYPQHRQLRSGYFLETVLPPLLPQDAAALIAFTNEDLYPDSSMYFVFGQASLENRVGVWSLWRLDDQADFDTFLRRTMKIAVHETGHMFSIRHCTKYECVMSGTNHLGETDRRPIDACPECMAKIAWINNEKPADRYLRLVKFSKDQRFTKELDEFAKKLGTVK
jgi:archaemetzincin